MLLVLRVSPLVFLHVYTTLTISFVDTSEFVKHAMETMNLRPDLLSNSLSLFPHLYHTYSV